MGTFSQALCSIAVCGVTSAMFFSGSDSYAQSANTETALEEIVVTAQRRTTDVQETAISASVLSGSMIESKGVTELYYLQYAAPSVNISSFGSANIFNIRGIGRSQVDIEVPSGVVIYRDGAPTVAGYFQREPYYDLESVEVYRGPQGTFVGKSAAGGAVFVNTMDPELASTYGSVEAGAGNFSAKEFTYIGNWAASDSVAVRVGFKHYSRDTVYDEITGNYTGSPDEVDNYSFRLGLLWQPTDRFRGLFKVDYHDLDFGGNPTTQYGEPLLSALNQQLYGREFEFIDKSLRAVLDLDYVFDNGVSLNSLTGFQDIEEHNNLDADIFGFESTSEVDIVTQEINLVSASEQRLQWVTGLFFEVQQANLLPWQDGGFNFFIDDQFPLVTSFWDKEDNYASVFGHITYDISDRLQFELGARYTHFSTEQTTEWLLNLDTSQPPDITLPTTIPFQQGSVGGDYQKISEDSLDGQIALNYTASDRHFLYGLVSRGHITGGINIFPGDPPNPPFLPYDEMQVINYEGGWKASWSDDRFRTQASIFYQDITDYQANFAEVGGVINNPSNRNASDGSMVAGFELSAQAALAEWDIDFGLALLESELGTFENIQNPLTGTLVDLSGARSPFSPDVTVNLGIAYGLRLNNGFRLIPRIDVAHQSDTQASLFQNPQFTLDARTLINAQVVLAPESEKWSLTFWGNNVTDQLYIGGIQNNATLYYAGAPRTFGVRFKYNYEL